MGVYIKGMEMPYKCALCDAAFPDGVGWSCPLIKGRPNIDNQKRRRTDCPLVPVQKHGRCIDENALLKGCGYIIADGMACIPVKYIADAPTIIPAEEE